MTFRVQRVSWSTLFDARPCDGRQRRDIPAAMPMNGMPERSATTAGLCFMRQSAAAGPRSENFAIANFRERYWITLPTMQSDALPAELRTSLHFTHRQDNPQAAAVDARNDLPVQISIDAEIHPAFATPIVQGRLGNADQLNQELRQAIRRQKSRSPGVRVSNYGGWQSDMELQEWAGAAGKHLLSVMHKAVQQVTRTRTGVPAPVWNVFAWANVNRCGDFNFPHIHPGNFWSAVYYVDAGVHDRNRPKGGEIEFFDPRGGVAAMYNPYYTAALPDGEAHGASMKISPQTSAFLIFPSYVLHSVAPYRGRHERISIAMNFALDPLDEQPTARF